MGQMSVIQSFWFQAHHRGYSDASSVAFRAFCAANEVLNVRTPKDETDKPIKPTSNREKQRAFVKKYGKQFKGLLLVLCGSFFLLLGWIP